MMVEAMADNSERWVLRGHSKDNREWCCRVEVLTAIEVVMVTADDDGTHSYIDDITWPDSGPPQHRPWWLFGRNTGLCEKEEAIIEAEPLQFCSVVDLGCLCRIPDPDFFHSRGSRIPDPTKKEDGKDQIVVLLFCSHKFTKLKTTKFFEQVKKNIWVNWQKTL
jgi:hypothetical protein